MAEMTELHNRDHKINSLVRLPGFLANCFQKGNGLVQKVFALYGGKHGFVMERPPTGEGPKAGEKRKVGTDELNKIGCFNNGGTGNPNVEPAGDKIIQQCFIIDNGR